MTVYSNVLKWDQGRITFNSVQAVDDLCSVLKIWASFYYNFYRISYYTPDCVPFNQFTASQNCICTLPTFDVTSSEYISLVILAYLKWPDNFLRINQMDYLFDDCRVFMKLPHGRFK